MRAGVAGLDAIECFAVGGIVFAPDVVGDAGLCHQVSLIGGVDESVPSEFLTRFHDDRPDLQVFLFYAYAVPQIEALSQYDRDVCFSEHFAKDLLRHFGLESPEGILTRSKERKVFTLLHRPRFVILVMRSDRPIKLSADPADDGGVARIGHAQATRGEPADVLGWLNEDGCLTHPGGLNGCCNSHRSSAVDNDIKMLGRSCHSDRQKSCEHPAINGIEYHGTLDYHSFWPLPRLTHWIRRRQWKQNISLADVASVPDMWRSRHHLPCQSRHQPRAM